jgi:SAM-dependent methyltransferase
MNSDLAPLLACPVCWRELIATAGLLRCANCGAEFPIMDGIPVFLLDAAEVVTVPSVHTSNAIGPQFEEILARGDERVLHLGAGSTATKYPGCIELEHKIFRHTDVVGDAHALPFRDSSFDRVFAFNVFEHLRDPARAAREILRVLKPGGALALHTAFLQPLHEAPRHFFNATEFGVREWFRDFEIEQCAVSGNFSPGFTLGFLAASLLETLRESDASAEAQSQLAHSRLEQWARFWTRKSEPPPGFDALLTLPQEFQKRLAAGFELLARKPGASPGPP